MAILFKRIEIEKERELEDIVIKNPEQIEEGLVFLTHQQQVSGGFIDVLCVDKDGILVIIELKITDDEGILLQALHYYDYVLINRAAIANQFTTKANININEEPRIVLIAPYFSERLKKACKYVNPILKLLEFMHLKTSAGEKGLYFNEVIIDTEAGYSPPQPIEKILEYINVVKLRDVCKEMIKIIISECKDLDEPITSGNTGIKIRYKNRKIVDIWVKRKFLWFSFF